jgi:hypothetical protein
VVSRRESGETPERVLVELKTMRPHGATIADATWLRLHDQLLSASLMSWFLDAFYAKTSAPPAP